MHVPRITLGIVIFLVQLFLLINVDWIYGEYARAAEHVLIVYLILTIGVMSALGKGLPVIAVTPFTLAGFFIAFFITAFLVLALPTTFIGSFEAIKLAMGFGLLHGFVKAFDEEIVFRYLLPKVARLGDAISSLLFGFFHFGIFMMFGLTWYEAIIPVVILTGLGYLWAKMRDNKYIGLLGSTGSHYAFNLGAFKILEKIIPVMI